MNSLVRVRILPLHTPRYDDTKSFKLEYMRASAARCFALLALPEHIPFAAVLCTNIISPGLSHQLCLFEAVLICTTCVPCPNLFS
jgi:hypothetical protein